MKKQVKIIMVFMGIFATVITTLIWFNTGIDVDTMTISPVTANQYFTEKGVVEYENLISVYPLVSGKVTQYFVKEGQEINSDDVICAMDTLDVAYQRNELEAQKSSIQEQKNNLTSIRAKEIDTLTQQKNELQNQLEILKAQENTTNISTATQIHLQNIIIEQNKKDIERTKIDVEKYRTLYEQGVVSEAEWKPYETTLTQLESQLEQNKKQKTLIESGTNQSSNEFFTTSKKAIQQQMEDLETIIHKDYNNAMKNYYDAQMAGIESSLKRLEHIQNKGEITSTTTGIVHSLPFKNNNVATETQPIALIGSGERVIVTYVSTNDIDTLSTGQEVSLILKRRLDDEIYSGTIASIDNKAQLKLSTLGVDERKVEVKIKPTSGLDQLKIGYDVDVRFLAYQQANALLVPKTAVFKENDISKIWKASNGIIRKVDILEGMKFNNNVVILSGLRTGDEIIKDATLKEIKDGTKIKR